MIKKSNEVADSPQEDRGVADAARWLTPPAIAEMLGIDAGKVLTWIRRGELSAVNLALTSTGRPRWRVDPKDLEKFLERRRTTPPPPKARRRRRQDEGVVQFYPLSTAA